MNRTDSPSVSKWAMVVLAMAALALAGCGRKGPLDLPPTAAGVNAAGDPIEAEPSAPARGGIFVPSTEADNGPAAPKGRKKSFILDPLLGN